MSWQQLLDIIEAGKKDFEQESNDIEAQMAQLQDDREWGIEAIPDD